MTIWTPILPEDANSKYEAIAIAIGNDISAGTLKPGQRLPTQRELSRQLSVTVGTVGRAYAIAEKRGLISLEVGRGSFVRSFGSRSSETGQRADVIDLGLNLPPVTEQSDLFSRTLARISNSRDIASLFGCAPVESFEHHRAAAAKWLCDRVECTSSDVVICSGAQNAIVSSLATLTKPGDSVLVEELTFPGMMAAAKLLRLDLVPVRMDARGIIIDDLDRMAKQSKSKVLYCVPTNQNPTTATLPDSRRRQIARLANKHDLCIIEDDVYGKLILDAPSPIASFAPDRTFLISSLAKTLSVGIRLAFVKVPSGYRESLLVQMRATNFFPSPLLCEIAADWINDTTAARLLLEQQRNAKCRQEIARSILEGQSIFGDPQGNHLWMNLPEAWSPETLERAARENGVNIFTSSVFMVSGQHPPNAIRVALGAARSESELSVGLKMLQRLLVAQHEESGSTKY